MASCRKRRTTRRGWKIDLNVTTFRHALLYERKQPVKSRVILWQHYFHTSKDLNGYVGFSSNSWLFYPPGLLHEWRLGPFCHSHIQKAGQPHLQQGVTTLQCNFWLHPLQDCILIDQLSCDVPTWGQILNLQPLQGLESPQPTTGPHRQWGPVVCDLPDNCNNPY